MSIGVGMINPRMITCPHCGAINRRPSKIALIRYGKTGINCRNCNKEIKLVKK